jgi:hypothetical protein
MHITAKVNKYSSQRKICLSAHFDLYNTGKAGGVQGKFVKNKE